MILNKLFLPPIPESMNKEHFRDKNEDIKENTHTIKSKAAHFTNYPDGFPHICQKFIFICIYIYRERNWPRLQICHVGRSWAKQKCFCDERESDACAKNALILTKISISAL